MLAAVMWTPLIQGFSLGASLIIAIGSQNAFVLRQGLRREHIFTITTICFLCDTFLILLGVAGFGTFVASTLDLLSIARWGGAAFLFLYGLRAFHSALKSNVMRVDESDNPASSLRWAVLTTLALTLLNPHVYLDTVILLGSIAGQYPADQRLAFAVGAAVASLAWFYGLGYGARVLSPIFSKPVTWRILDTLIGCIMWAIATGLIRPVISNT